jgi:dihydropteroate synthase
MKLAYDQRNDAIDMIAEIRAQDEDGDIDLVAYDAEVARLGPLAYSDLILNMTQLGIRPEDLS